MVLSDYSKLRILSLWWRRHKISTIVEYLVLEDGVKISKQGVRQFQDRYLYYLTIGRKEGSGLNAKLSPAIQQVIENAMREDDETTACHSIPSNAGCERHFRFSVLSRQIWSPPQMVPPGPNISKYSVRGDQIFLKYTVPPWNGWSPPFSQGGPNIAVMFCPPYAIFLFVSVSGSNCCHLYLYVSTVSSNNYVQGYILVLVSSAGPTVPLY